MKDIMSSKQTYSISHTTHTDLNTICEKFNILLLGVTGGIASGKSTVALMLQEVGAPIIDFDVLAREVVEPGMPALKKIVDYFGGEVLLADGYLDRKRLSEIIFRDPDKRRILEAITHPPIMDEYLRHIDAIARKEPGAIIQAIIPLLYEVNLQDLVHKILVVHIPREIQIARLIRRDGIGREEALNILNAQLSIDKKALRADFVIHNEDSLYATRKQVEELWETLRGFRK